MAQENKFYLPYVLDGVIKKLSALFLKKLVLFDSEILQAKHLRHYDHECQGLMSLVNFLQRKINKNSVFAFQMIKNPDSKFTEDGQFIQEDELKDVAQKTSLKFLQETTTPRTKFLSRVNTTFQESDNSLIFSPNAKRYGKITSRTQYMGSNLGEKNEILQKLLNRVKKVNTQASQQFINPNKSSYFNLTLGKQSLQTFQNNCNCECHNESCNKETKMMKRKRILQKFERIEQKIYDQSPIYVASYVTPKPVNQVKKYRNPKTTYSVYDPTMYEQRPQEIIYVKKLTKRDPYYEVRSTGMSTSKSVAHIGYAHQVYV